MIVVEGPDGAGKTTLINNLIKYTGLEVAPRVVSEDAKKMTDLKAWVEDNVSKGFQSLIFDRHRLISEPIYGPVLRSTQEPEFNNQEWFRDQLRAFYACDPIIIYCLPPWPSVWMNVLETEANSIFHGSPQKMKLIYQSYVNKALTELVLRDRTWIYDYRETVIAPATLAAVVEEIKRNTHV